MRMDKKGLGKEKGNGSGQRTERRLRGGVKEEVGRGMEGRKGAGLKRSKYWGSPLDAPQKYQI